ncbi:hypothetical protein TUMEXPCC7403_12740 [Tumidithrix helvetica PCC 7403]
MRSTEVLSPLKAPVLLASDIEEVASILKDIQGRIEREGKRFSG